VILDWVPAHFPNDAHGLARFDGTACTSTPTRAGLAPRLEDADLQLRPPRGPRLPAQQRALLARALPHRRPARGRAWPRCSTSTTRAGEGEWIPNEHGGRENLEAIASCASSTRCSRRAPGALTIAEESTAWPMVSRPTYVGGLGFHYKWNMGWMHDTLPTSRATRCTAATTTTAHLRHDVRLHRELRAAAVARRGGARQGLAAGQDARRRLAEVRQPALLYGYMWAHPGKKLLFMGGEFGQSAAAA
jgi:1,4-alpha-glucan branching enzyme